MAQRIKGHWAHSLSQNRTPWYPNKLIKALRVVRISIYLGNIFIPFYTRWQRNRRYETDTEQAFIHNLLSLRALLDSYIAVSPDSGSSELLSTGY